MQNFDNLFWHNSNFYYGLPNYLANFYFPGGCLLAVGEQNGTLVNSWMAVKLTLEPDYFDEAGNRQQPGAGPCLARLRAGGCGLSSSAASLISAILR